MMELFTWEGILALLLGGLYGSLFGAIPGLTATLAVALFIPVAFFLDPIIALPAIIAISSVAIYAGGRRLYRGSNSPGPRPVPPTWKNCTAFPREGALFTGSESARWVRLSVASLVHFY